jgi:predicted metalloendopeptidase
MLLRRIATAFTEKTAAGLIDGYTPEQRLFISWATIWRSKCGH